MAKNGDRKPPRPRLELISAAASPAEAAALVAALEAFLAETTPVAQTESRPSPWQGAGLIEGVTAKRHALPPDPGSGLPFS